MKKVAVVYWSGTGNTESMAALIADGAARAGADVSTFRVSEFNAGMVSGFDSIAFGCPAMGSEQLEDCEFEPLFTSCIPMLGNKSIALFGSYGWGAGEWMQSWEENCRDAGLELSSNSVICAGAPDGSAESECIALGAALA